MKIDSETDAHPKCPSNIVFKQTDSLNMSVTAIWFLVLLHKEAVPFPSTERRNII